MSNDIRLPAIVYPRHCLDATIECCANFCLVQQIINGPDEYRIRIVPLAHTHDDGKVAREFLDDLLRRSLAYHLGQNPA